MYFGMKIIVESKLGGDAIELTAKDAIPQYPH